MDHDKYLQVAGSFECIVEKPQAGWFGETGDRKTPFIRIPCRVTEGPQKGKRITFSGWISEAALDNTVAALTKTFGFDGDLYSLHIGKITLAGMPCNITTEVETYQGRPRCKAKWLNPPGRGGAKPMDEAKVNSILKSLLSRSKAVAKATREEAAKSNSSLPSMTTAMASSETAPNSPDEGGEDVPF
jgi:hypothetical protein